MLVPLVVMVLMLILAVQLLLLMVPVLVLQVLSLVWRLLLVLMRISVRVLVEVRPRLLRGVVLKVIVLALLVLVQIYAYSEIKMDVWCIHERKGASMKGQNTIANQCIRKSNHINENVIPTNRVGEILGPLHLFALF